MFTHRLKMAGDLGGGGALIDHHIGVIPQGPQGVHPGRGPADGCCRSWSVHTPAGSGRFGWLVCATKRRKCSVRSSSGLSQAKCTALVRTLFSRAMLSGFVSRMSSPWVKSTSAGWQQAVPAVPHGPGQASRLGSSSLISSSPRQNSDRSATLALLRPSLPLTMQNPQFLGQPRLKKP